MCYAKQWCVKQNYKLRDQCQEWSRAGLAPHILFERESMVGALMPPEPFAFAEKNGIETVMRFLCAPVTKPWWPPDPIVGPSAATIAEGPMSRLAHDLAGKTMIMVTSRPDPHRSQLHLTVIRLASSIPSGEVSQQIQGFTEAP